MINIKPDIYAALQPLTDNVADTYPEDWEQLPVLIFSEIANEPVVITGDQEQTSRIVYQVDIFDTTSASDLAVRANQALMSLGFIRTSAQDVPDPTLGIKHKQMQFEGEVDNRTLQVYHKNQ